MMADLKKGTLWVDLLSWTQMVKKSSGLVWEQPSLRCPSECLEIIS